MGDNVKTPVPAESRQAVDDPWSGTVAAACEGSRAAQGRLFADLRKYLRSRAGVVLDRELQVKVSPSDLVQETLMEAYRAFDKFEGKTRGELILWLQGILKNQVKMAHRRYRGTGKRDMRREERVDYRGSRASRWSPVDGAATTPSGQMHKNEQVERLERAIAKLPPRQEQVVRLRNELRLTFEEAGKVLGCSAGAAEKLWTRAVDRLTRELNDEK
nr:sigma-70 family RNA polymerase sigma factor [Aeoliella straminimaris]